MKTLPDYLNNIHKTLKLFIFYIILNSFILGLLIYLIGISKICNVDLFAIILIICATIAATISLFSIIIFLVLYLKYHKIRKN